MAAIECVLMHGVQKAALSLLHRAVPFPDEPDLLASVLPVRLSGPSSSPVCCLLVLSV